MILGVLKKYSKMLTHKNIKKLQIKIQINSDNIHKKIFFPVNTAQIQQISVYHIQEL
jgi:hypothetical protein